MFCQSLRLLHVDMPPYDMPRPGRLPRRERISSKVLIFGKFLWADHRGLGSLHRTPYFVHYGESRPVWPEPASLQIANITLAGAECWRCEVPSEQEK